MYRFSWRAFFESFLPDRVWRRLDAKRRRQAAVERRVTHGHVSVPAPKDEP